MIYKGVNILDEKLNPITTQKFAYIGQVKKELLDRFVAWAKSHNTKTISVIHLTTPVQAKKFNTDGTIHLGKSFENMPGTANFGIWKVYGNMSAVTKDNPRGRHRYLDWKKATEEAAEELERKRKPTEEEYYNGAEQDNPRKKEMKMGIPDKKPSLFKIMDEIDETPNEYRFRMQPPSKFHEDSLKYGKKAITRGVRAIYGCPSGYWKASDIAKEGKCRKGMVMQSLRLSKDVFHSKTEAARWIAKHTKPRRE